MDYQKFKQKHSGWLISVFFIILLFSSNAFSLEIVSGSDWCATDQAPRDGWKEKGFFGNEWRCDGSHDRWRPAYPTPTDDPYPNSIDVGEIIPGTSAKYMWYWDDENNKPTGKNGANEAFFRYTFNIPELNDNIIARANIIADDNFEFYVNDSENLFKDISTRVEDNRNADTLIPIPLNIEKVQQELNTNRALGICMFRQDESPKPKSFSGVKVKILDENNKRSSVIKCQRSKIHETGALVCKLDCDPDSSDEIEGVIQFLDVDNNFVNSDVYFLVQDESTDFDSEDKDELKYEFLFENCAALTDTPIPNHIFLLYRTKLIDNLIKRFGNNNIGNRF